MDVAELTLGALFVAVLVSALPLSASLIVGVAVSVFQAATSLQEQTLSFVPKLSAVMLSLVLLSGFIFDNLYELFEQALEYIEVL